MRVALLTTGNTEFLGLPGALRRLFPGHDFVAIEDVPGRNFLGFTSLRLPVPHSGAPTNLDRIVAKAVSLVDPARTCPYDLVVILEDLELVNRDQPAVVVQEVRAAFTRHLDDLAQTPERRVALSAALQRKVSFHLAVPMIESWFFGAPGALSALGVTGATSYHIRPGDPEDFEATDHAYITAQEAVCSCWCSYRRPRKYRPKWIGAGSERIYHPKGYLQWLLIKPEDKSCTTYREGAAGMNALAPLDWEHLLAVPGSFSYARALVDDLACGLNQDPTVGSWMGDLAEETSIRRLPDAPTLRNI